MTDKSASSLERLLGVLDLFDESHPMRTADEIAAALEVSQPTGYRYVRLLLEAGLLQRGQHSQYMLGPRIILLDHHIRRADPVLREGIPVMRELVAQTGLDCVLTGLYGDSPLDTHREHGSAPLPLAYGRGRPRPRFRSGAPKVLLSALPTTQLKRIFDAHRAEAVAAGLPDDWSAFRRYFAQIRKAGYYVSRGELEPAVGSVTAPIPRADAGAWAALALVFDLGRLAIIDVERTARLVIDAAERIGARLAAQPIFTAPDTPDDSVDAVDTTPGMHARAFRSIR